MILFKNIKELVQVRAEGVVAALACRARDGRPNVARSGDMVPEYPLGAERGGLGKVPARRNAQSA